MQLMVPIHGKTDRRGLRSQCVKRLAECHSRQSRVIGFPDNQQPESEWPVHFGPWTSHSEEPYKNKHHDYQGYQEKKDVCTSTYMKPLDLCWQKNSCEWPCPPKGSKLWAPPPTPCQFVCKDGLSNVACPVLTMTCSNQSHLLLFFDQGPAVCSFLLTLQECMGALCQRATASHFRVPPTGHRTRRRDKRAWKSSWTTNLALHKYQPEPTWHLQAWLVLHLMQYNSGNKNALPSCAPSDFPYVYTITSIGQVS